jgi:molecular chaperone GrpE
MAKQKEKKDKDKEMGEAQDQPEMEGNTTASSVIEEAADESLEAVSPPDEAELEEVVEEVDVEELQAEISRLTKESEEYLDGWQRARAEFANYKKRTKRNYDDTRETILIGVITPYLDILDDLERALMDRPTDPASEAWAKGIYLIYQKLSAILDSAGVTEILAEGLTFDPNLHEAISYEESSNFEDGQVIEVMKNGYMLGDRVIRPALVRVAK